MERDGRWMDHSLGLALPNGECFGAPGYGGQHLPTAQGRGPFLSFALHLHSFLIPFPACLQTQPGYIPGM